MNVGAIGIEGRHRAHDAHHDRHRMRIASEPAEEVLHLLMQHRVHGDAVLEILELFGRRQLAVKQQVAHLEIMRFLGQLVDRIPAMQKLALVAVDIGDRAVAGGGGREARVVGEDIALRIELADVDHIRAGARRQDRQFQLGVAKRKLRGFRGFGHGCPSLGRPGARPPCRGNRKAGGPAVMMPRPEGARWFHHAPERASCRRHWGRFGALQEQLLTAARPCQA